TLLFTNAGDYVHAMVYSRISKDVVNRSGRAGLWIGSSKGEPRDARVDHRAGAHHAWFHRGVHRRAGQPVISQAAFGFPQCDHFGVRRWVIRRNRLVETAAYDGSVRDNYSADWNFA